ncbi:hypothetical protein ACFL7D_06980 [candidate division KSB1 bacterium]
MHFCKIFKSKKSLTSAIVIFAFVFIAFNSQQNTGRIYGRLLLNNGDEIEGRISLGDTVFETLWIHPFNAEYDFFEHNRDAYDRQRKLHNRVSDVINKLTVMYGYIEKMTNERNRVNVLLKDGREFLVYGGDSREQLSVLDADGISYKVSWRDLSSIEFSEEPESYSESINEITLPLFGVVSLNSGQKFKGFLIWDKDESLSTDLLNGREGRYDREIPFGSIKRIRPLNRSSSEITMWSNRQLVLTGTNDVDNENRGLVVLNNDIGIIEIEWKFVTNVDFERNVYGKSYSDFEPGKPVHGVVTNSRGEQFEGFIKWDDDENMSIDYLNGELDGLIFIIEFSNIAEIRRRTRRSSTVVLKNGVELRLSNTNDVDYNNKGIVVLENPDDPEGKIFQWDEFEKLVLTK